MVERDQISLALSSLASYRLCFILRFLTCLTCCNDEVSKRIVDLEAKSPFLISGLAPSTIELPINPNVALL